MSDPLYIRGDEDWAGFGKLKTAKRLLQVAKNRGLVGKGEAEEMRFWVARSYAMKRGRTPHKYFYWLLQNPESSIPQWAEVEAMQEMKRGQQAEPPKDPNVDPTRLGDIQHKHGDKA